MSFKERENYRPEDQFFQDDETRYEDDSIDTYPTDHSVSDNAEPDYGDDFDNQKPNENPDDDTFDDEDDFDDDDTEEDEDEEDDDLGDDDLQDDDLDKESRED